MSTFSASIAASGNDGRWTEGNSGFSSTATLPAGYWDATNGRANFFLRFTGVTIPKGSTISAATCTLTGAGNYANNTVNWLIDAIAADSPAAPTTYSGAETAARTTANVAVAAVAAITSGSSFTTADFTAVIQELVNRAGWASGNAVVIYIEDNGSTTASTFTDRAFYSYDNAYYPTLNITYTAPATGFVHSQAVGVA